MKMTRHPVAACLVWQLLATAAFAQSRGPTPADYERARHFLAPALQGLVIGGSVNPNWAPDGRFWYRNATAAGEEIIVVDPAKKTRVRCDVTGSACAGLSISADSGRSGRGGGRGGFGARGPTSASGAPLSVSPDGKRGAFVRDWNLWVQRHCVRSGASTHDRWRRELRLRDRQRGLEQQRSRDGVVVAGLASGSRRSSRTSERSARCISCSTTVGHPQLARREVPAARRQRHGDAAPGRDRRRRRHGHSLADAARLSSRHARRRHPDGRLRLESRRQPSSRSRPWRAITSARG